MQSKLRFLENGKVFPGLVNYFMKDFAETIFKVKILGSKKVCKICKIQTFI